jgi:hypothetical protein
MRAEFVCDGKPIVDKAGRFDVIVPPKAGDYVVHDKCRWKIVEVVHDIGRGWLQCVCHDETPVEAKPVEETSRRRRFRVSDGT